MFYDDDDQIYYFEWTVNGGHTKFGYHGTQEMFDAKMLLDRKQYGSKTINLTQKKFCCTGKEQMEYQKALKAALDSD
jgi:hypothetical protein